MPASGQDTEVTLPGAGGPPPGAGSAVFERFRGAVEEDFARVRTVAVYARRLGWSERTLTRACREATGRSAKEFVDDRVVLQARRELLHTDAPVARIARGLGFEDPANFTAFFRHRTGTLPLQFRRAGRDAPRAGTLSGTAP